MNFEHDLAKFAREMMVDAGVKVSENWDDCYTCIKYLELCHRWFDSSVPYIVVFSKELQRKIPLLTKNERLALQDIIHRMKNCLSITLYMSKDIKETEIKKSDFFLKNWNIYHLHLEKRIVKKRFSNNNLLFFQPKGQVVHMIDIKKHPKGAAWFDRELIEIVYNNWPWLLHYIPNSKVIGAIEDSKVHNELKQTVVLIPFKNGTLFPTNLGVASSGDSGLAVRGAYDILNRLKQCEICLNDEEEKIRKEIYESTSIQVNEQLDYTLIIEEGFFVAYEKHTNSKIKLFEAK